MAAYSARPRLAPYGLGRAGTAVCTPVAPGRRVQVCARWPAEPGPAVRGVRDVCHILRGAVDADRESFYVLHLDAHNRVQGLEEVAKGDLTGVAVHPREVFKAAILSNAAAVILAHNHPSGVTRPSAADLEITERLTSVGQLVGIPVRDHVITGRESDSCYSMRADGSIAFAFGAARPRRRRKRRRRI